MLSRNVSAAGCLRSTKVGVSETRLISTVSATEILRSVQKGCEIVPGFTRLPLLVWQLSMSSIFGVGIESWWLLFSGEALSSGRRIQSLCESLGNLLRWVRALLLCLQRGSDEWDECRFLRMVRSWRRAGMDATAIAIFCSRLQGWIRVVGRNEKGELAGNIGNDEG